MSDEEISALVRAFCALVEQGTVPAEPARPEAGPGCWRQAASAWW
ncbi:hypothetical protein [Kutzneria buriramensis]|nr:hypothetical protein [Kutzneria buriramensis]